MNSHKHAHTQTQKIKLCTVKTLPVDKILNPDLIKSRFKFITKVRKIISPLNLIEFAIYFISGTNICKKIGTYDEGFHFLFSAASSSCFKYQHFLALKIISVGDGRVYFLSDILTVWFFAPETFSIDDQRSEKYGKPSKPSSFIGILSHPLAHKNDLNLTYGRRKFRKRDANGKSFHHVVLLESDLNEVNAERETVTFN